MRYTLDGTKILRETGDSNTLIPLYDNEDGVCGILYNNVPYYFIKNLQGDVIAIVDKDAQTVARYSYDAWGVCTVTQDSVGIATINPFRYRTYYYDEEISLYYLQSRYYNPIIGRFVNSDDVDVLFIDQGNKTQNNLFSYCLNNPINNKDVSGKWIQVVVGALFGAVIAAISYWLEWKFGLRTWNNWHFAGYIALAAALGAIGGYFKYWANFTKLSLRIGIRLHLITGIKAYKLIAMLIKLAPTGISFVINSIAKSFTRKPGESWIKFIKRYFGWG